MAIHHNVNNFMEKVYNVQEKIIVLIVHVVKNKILNLMMIVFHIPQNVDMMEINV